MSTFMQEMRQLQPVSNEILDNCTKLKIATLFLLAMQVDPEKPVLVAGDPERTHEVKVVSDGGIWYHNNLIDALVSVFSIGIMV